MNLDLPLSQSFQEVAPPAAFNGRIFSEKDTLFFYFFHGDEQFTTPEEFVAHWKRISNFDFAPKSLVGIIEKSATHIKQIYDDRAVRFAFAIAPVWSHWEKPVRDKIPAFNNVDLALSLAGCAKLSVLPTDQFIDEWLERAETVIDTFRARDLVMTLNASARLGLILPASFLEKWEKEAIKKLAEFDLQKTAQVLWSIAALDSIFNDPQHKNIFNLFKKLVPDHIETSLEKNINAILKQIHDAHLWFGEPSSITNPVHINRKSGMERSFAHRLQQLGFTVESDLQCVPVLRKAIDFKVSRAASPEEFLIETDGPIHFLAVAQSNDVCYDGGTLFRTALIHKQVPDQIVIRLPYDFAKKWLETRGSYIQAEVMNDILDLAAAKGPGAYDVAWIDRKILVNPMPIAAMLDREEAAAPVMPASMPQRPLQPA